MMSTMNNMEYLDAATPMINVHECYDDDDDDDDNNNKVNDDIDDNSSTRNTTASTCTSTTQQQQQQRRLTNSKVREIFECLYQINGNKNGTTDVGSQQPPKIPIPVTIVPGNSNGKALSPPSYEFEYGLYILLRPAKGGKNNKSNHGSHHDPPTATSPVPEHLKHLVMTEYPPETCKWQLSGPQFPTPTAIQQRYCYPQGREEYSQCTGSALWTMYNADGVENKEFRLLHVYYSTKRLHNGGVRNGKSTLDTINVDDRNVSVDDGGSVYTSNSVSTKSPSKQRKLPKRHKPNKLKHQSKQQREEQWRMAHALPSPSAASPVLHNSFSRIQQQHHYPPKQPAIADSYPPLTPIRYGPPATYHTTTMGRSGYIVSPPSPWPDVSTGTSTSTTGSVAKNSSMNQNHHYSYRPQQPFQHYYDRSMLMMESSNIDEHLQPNHDPYEYSYNDHVPTTNGSSPAQILPFRRHHHHRHHHDHCFDDYEVVPTNPNETSTIDVTILSSSTDETFPKFTNDFDHHNDDIHSIMMTPIHIGNADEDTDSVSLWEDVSGDRKTTHDLDPFTRMTRPTTHQKEAATTNHSLATHTSKGDDIFHKTDSIELQNDSHAFQTSLQVVHTKLRDCIYKAPRHDQAELVQLLSSWARQLAEDPLMILAPSKSSVESSMTTTNNHKPASNNDCHEVPSKSVVYTTSDLDDDNNMCDADDNEKDFAEV